MRQVYGALKSQKIHMYRLVKFMIFMNFSFDLGMKNGFDKHRNFYNADNNLFNQCALENQV